jgi:restriction system protein
VRKKLKTLFKEGRHSEIEALLGEKGISQADLKALESVHPMFMGGNYLPDAARRPVSSGRPSRLGPRGSCGVRHVRSWWKLTWGRSDAIPGLTPSPKDRQRSEPLTDPPRYALMDLRARHTTFGLAALLIATAFSGPAYGSYDGGPFDSIIFVANSPGTIFWSLLILAGLVLIARASYRNHVRQRTLRKAAVIIERHLPSLIRRREQLVRQDAYGKLRKENWVKEVNYFMEEHINPYLISGERDAFVSERATIEDMIFGAVETEREKNPAFLTFSDNMTPHEFETFCAEQLRHAGWDARVTMQSRDQGVDVIAEKSGVRVVVQCKLYFRPVGNKAVQEIAAARTHEQADYGVVVSNNRYTQDAEQLASTNKILLLHYTDLCNLHDIIPLKTSARESDWYYCDAGGQVGPLTLQKLRETLATFSNTNDVFVWREGFADWKPLQDIPELTAQKTRRATRASMTSSYSVSVALGPPDMPKKTK